jgi:hypothetical protein
LEGAIKEVAYPDKSKPCVRKDRIIEELNVQENHVHFFVLVRMNVFSGSIPIQKVVVSQGFSGLEHRMKSGALFFCQ